MSDVDGRSVRRERNRVAVLDAVIELFAEDMLAPRPDDVARRSGVSLRSVYRYFSDPEELLGAAMARHMERTLPLMQLDRVGEGPLEDRIARFVRMRRGLYDAVAPVARAARAAAPSNPAVAAQYERALTHLREQIEDHFAPELRRMSARVRGAVVDAVDTLFQLESYDHLHRTLRHPESRVTGAQLEALRRLLG